MKSTSQSRNNSYQIRLLQQKVAQATESNRIYEEQIAGLSQNLNAMHNSINETNARIAEIQKQFSIFSERDQQLRQELNSVKGVITAEQKARKAALDKMAEQIARQMSDMVKSIERSTAASYSSSSRSSGPAGPGSFYEYKVQPGATLSAIAHAYNVSVSDIKKANRLKDDVIMVGQKLYIPKK
jgi:LysM repeat protein